MSASVTVKSFLVVSGKDNDIRRFKLAAPSFQMLCESIRSNYQLQDFAVKYKDDENELVTIATDDEFADALSAVKPADVLKVYIYPRENRPVQPRQAPAPSGALPSNPPASSFAGSSSSSSSSISSSSSSASSSSSSPSSARSTFSPIGSGASGASANPVPQELIGLLKTLFAVPTVQAVLPSAFSVLVQALRNGDTTQTVIELVLATFPELRDQPAMQRILVLLPPYYPTLDAYRTELLARPAALDMLAAFGPQLLGMLPMYFEMGFNPLAQMMNGPSGDAQRPMNVDDGDRESALPSDVHQGVQCDGCTVNPIVGCRFKCAVCPNYDLCSSCEAKNLHPQHTFIKHRAPAAAHEPGVHLGVRCDGCNISPIVGVRFKCSVCPNYDLCNSCESKNLHSHHTFIQCRAPIPQEPGFRRWPFHHGHGFPGGFHGGFQHGGFHGHHGWRHGPRHGSCGSAKSWWRQDSEDYGDMKADFVRAKTLTDDKAPVPGGATLVKTWEIRNTGTKPWPRGTKLIYKKGDLASTENEYEVPLAAPGQSVDVSAVVQTPHVAGRYKAMFRLATEEGKFFGDKLWCDVFVRPQNPAPSAPPMDLKTMYAQQLQELSQWGLTDEDLNVSLLAQHDGDAQKVRVFLTNGL